MRSYGTVISAKGVFVGLMAIFFLIGLGGCTKYVWYHHDQKTPLNFQNDRSQCEEDLTKYRADAGKPLAEAAVKQRMNDCMKARGYGWGPVNDAPNDSFIFEDNR